MNTEMTNLPLDLDVAELEAMEAPDFWGGFVVGVGAGIAALGTAAAIVALT
ncbi:hypothetical protein ARGLB_080_00150 [Arthrobacter globiformis NBRC 12137]|jgi:hypothetical protein|uniref:Uncharacterized protein n=1 Tax=Arthrobacter globiformis (strain ATCC 8010 / DSM 20124 / JCM 1332 / NBRC 12137 / NCIMB 8907 / NRRL B-2979 / 168) TaxID=1077972 RepID=H0QQ50_ARTG1|nr:daptide-type RiPP [Arthrobacter globiformis]GAB14951.1 hypothetical protein ARGLB_080_00150 [Arthrobacter globiformis NBRC 12137]